MKKIFMEYDNPNIYNYNCNLTLHSLINIIYSM